MGDAGIRLKVPFAEVMERARSGEFGEVYEGAGRAGEPGLFVDAEVVERVAVESGLTWTEADAVRAPVLRHAPTKVSKYIVED